MSSESLITAPATPRIGPIFTMIFKCMSSGDGHDMSNSHNWNTRTASICAFW